MAHLVGARSIEARERLRKLTHVDGVAGGELAPLRRDLGPLKTEHVNDAVERAVIKLQVPKCRRKRGRS